MSERELAQVRALRERFTRYDTALRAVQRSAPAAFRAVRQHLGDGQAPITQQALAERLGVPASTVSKVEAGTLRPGMPLLRKLGEALDKADREWPGD